MSSRVVLNPVGIKALEVGNSMQSGLQRVGEQVAERAAADAPKASGAGAASIAAETTVDQDGVVTRVSWDRDHFYMFFPEVGTSRMTARPFLRPALDGTYNL